MAKTIKCDDNLECIKCNKEIEADEYIINFGYCNECLDKSYEEYMKSR